MTTQAVKYSKIFVPIIFLWLNIIFEWIPAVSARKSIKPTLIALPLVALILFGIYSIFSVVHGVYSLHDRPEEAESLRKEIIEAKADLRRRGLRID